MKVRITIPTVLVCLICSVIYSAEQEADPSETAKLAPIETFCIEPVEIENISIWVPAAKAVPVINYACRAKRGCTYSSVLPATVHHTKERSCPEPVARLLAEQTAVYHRKSLPLTIFNGWQWEYSFSLCQYDSKAYDLPGRGGCWESSWEAILTESCGCSTFRWLSLGTSETAKNYTARNEDKSNIVVKTFSSMRVRDGYPKERRF